MALRRLPVNWRYAVGEIAIIVIGILIAIALDNWNDARTGRRLEHEYLTRLEEDLRADTATFRLMDRAVKRKSSALSTVDSTLRHGMTRDTLALLQALISGSNFAWNQGRARTATFEELQSTGNLRLIRDSELRAQIVRYYASVEGDYERIRSRRTRYGPLTYELLPRKEEFVLDSAAARTRLNALTTAVLGSDIRSALMAERNFAAFVRSMHTELLDRAVLLLAYVENGRPPQSVR